MLETLVMVVHRYRQDALGSGLADHVLIQQFGNFLRCRQVGFGARDRLHAGGFVANDVVAQINTFVADEDGWTCNQFLDFVLAFSAERAVKQFLAAGCFFVGHRGQM